MKIKNEKRYSIGVLIDFFTDKYQYDIFSGIIEASEKYDINLINYVGGYIGAPDSHHAPRKAVYNLVDLKFLDGIIIFSSSIGSNVDKEKLIEFINKFSDVKIISIGIAIEGIPSITIDNYHGMYKIVEHLIKDHHNKKIAFIKGSEGNKEGEVRFSAYKNALIDNKIKFDENLTIQGNFYYGSGEKAVAELIDNKKYKIDSIIAANDIMAIDAINALQKRDIHVPYDIAVVGFDNMDEGKMLKPSLSTVSQPLTEIGYTSVKKIISLIKNEKIEENTVLTPNIVYRHSCGCYSYKKSLFQHFYNYDNNLKIDKFIDTKNILLEDIKKLDLDTYIFQIIIKLLDAIYEDLSNKITKKFLITLEKQLEKLKNINVNFIDFQYYISVIFNKICKFLKSNQEVEHLFTLYNYAIEIIWEEERKIQTDRTMKTEQELRDLHVISIDLINTFELNDFKQVVNNHIHKLGFNNCFIYLYDQNIDNLEISNRMLSYIDEKLDSSAKKKIDSNKFLMDVLENVKPSGRYSYLIMALFYEKTQLGFIVYNTKNMSGSIYETLTTQISGALRGVRLVKKIQNHTKELEKKVSERTIKLEEAKKELEKINKSLTKLDSMKNDFIANITHNFRSPLTGILNMADLAIKEADDKKDIENYQIIYNSSLKLKKSIDKLLNLARMDAQGVKLRVKKVDPKLFLDNLLNFYSSSTVGSGINIIKKYPAENIDNFYSDEEKLEEIVNNIMFNAIKFVDKDNGEINIEIINKNDELLFCISDNGIGIPKEKIDTIFNRFEQAHSGMKTTNRGTGIGLAYSKQLAEYLHGKIWAESKGVNQGSQFYIQLPKDKSIFNSSDFISDGIKKVSHDDIKILIKDEIEKKSEKKETLTIFNDLNEDNEFNYKKGKILIIDDDKNIREIVMRYLLNNSYKNFIISKDGKQGLDAVYDFAPDLIICDFNMPHMRGDTFHDNLITNPDFRNIPFVFLSAIADSELILERRKKGAIAFLKKPIEENELIITVEQHLKKYFEYLKTLKLATLDELSGLKNKREILNNLNHELSFRKFRDLSIIFFDIDSFKKINDTYGHQAGDKVINKIGKLLLSYLRDYDIAGRYGGDEFIIILPDTNLENAHSVAEIIREKINTVKILYEDSIIKIHSSFGLASLIDNSKYIETTLKIDNLKDVFELKNTNHKHIEKVKKYKKEISNLLIKMSDMSLYTAKQTKCNNCGFNSVKPQLFNNTCPKCGSTDITFGRNKIVKFQEIQDNNIK